jgi:hypothetical protein
MKKNRNLMKTFLGSLGRIPGTIDCYLTVVDLLGKVPVYDASWRHLPDWIERISAMKCPGGPARGRRILFFGVYQRWVDYCLALSMLLLGQGAEVDFAWLPTPSPLPGERTVTFDHWIRSERRNRRRCAHPRFHLYDLAKVKPGEPTAEMERFADKQAAIDVSYLLQKERIDLRGDERDAGTFEFRRRRNLDAVRRMAAFLKGRNYDRIILPSGGILEFGAVFRYLSAEGVDVTTIETCDANGRIWVSNNGSVASIDTSSLWEQDAPHVLDPERKKRVSKIIETRQTPASPDLQIRYQRSGTDAPEATLGRLGISGDRPVLLLCPNVPFDAVFYGDGRKLFAGMWEWLVESCRFLAGRTDCDAILRCHPAEPHFDTPETTEAILKEFLPPLPGHVRLIRPEDPVSTYSLMEIADLGLVYASTTGLEMAMRGIPVICGNPSQHYNRKGFTIDPPSREEFFGEIDRRLKSPKGARLSGRQVELAWCYADVYFNQWYIPFPWLGGPIWGNLKDWPIERMLSQEGRASHESVLGTLLGK